MDHRNLKLGAFIGAGLMGFVGVAATAVAETIATDAGIAVKQPDVPAPTRGMTMHEVASKFGDPVTKIPPVGKPPISRWEYPGFIVYFEYDHVIDSVAPAS
jgi:hypothetical protein